VGTAKQSFEMITSVEVTTFDFVQNSKLLAPVE
jgi:hypothetical protein